MSLRPMLFASSIDPITRAAATHDTSLLGAVIESLNPGIREKARPEITSLLAGNLAGKPETDDHIYLVAAIAKVLGVQVKEALIADGQWKESAWSEYFRALWELLDSRGQELVELLARRPVFGSSFKSTWPHYGYLRLGEVSELLTKVQNAVRQKPDVASTDFLGGFHGVIVGWLSEVERRGTDLWLFAC